MNHCKKKKIKPEERFRNYIKKSFEIKENLKRQKKNIEKEEKRFLLLYFFMKKKNCSQINLPSFMFAVIIYLSYLINDQ